MKEQHLLLGLVVEVLAALHGPRHDDARERHEGERETLIVVARARRVHKVLSQGAEPGGSTQVNVKLGQLDVLGDAAASRLVEGDGAADAFIAVQQMGCDLLGGEDKGSDFGSGGDVGRVRLHLGCDSKVNHVDS